MSWEEEQRSKLLDDYNSGRITIKELDKMTAALGKMEHATY